MSVLMKHRREALRRAAGGWLTALLAFGMGGAGRVAFAGEAPAQTPAALTVSSDPAGAAVYVDGQPRGTTPLTLDGIRPGDHRVKVVKEGYLENSRLVSLKPGRTEAVEVSMTASRAQEPQGGTAAAEEKEKESFWGTHKKMILIGAGGVAAGAVIVAAASGGEPENLPPSPGTVSISPTGIGLAAVTSFTFTAQGATDPNADILTFSWSFGDGETGTGQAVTHVYGKAGVFQATLTVSDGKAAATVNAASSVTVKDVTGTWINTRGKAGVPEGIIRKLVITQTGATFSGTYTNSEVPGTRGTATGTLSPPRNVSFSAPLLDVPFNFTGTIDEEVLKWDGRGNAGGELGNVPMVFGREQ